MAEKKLRKRSGFEIYSYFKDSTLTQQLNSVQGSKLGMWVQFINRRYTKGMPFQSKMVYKAIPIKCFVSYRPPSREGGSVGWAKKKNEHMIAYEISCLVCKR